MILHEYVYFLLGTIYNARQSTDVDYFIMSIQELGMLNYTFGPMLVLVCTILRNFMILFNTSQSVYFSRQLDMSIQKFGFCTISCVRDSCIWVPSPNVTIAIRLMVDIICRKYLYNIIRSGNEYFVFLYTYDNLMSDVPGKYKKNTYIYVNS